MRVLGELESGFSEVEVALLALEDTIDAREAQEGTHPFRVAQCQEQLERHVCFTQPLGIPTKER